MHHRTWLDTLSEVLLVYGPLLQNEDISHCGNGPYCLQKWANMSGKIFKRAIATLTLATLPVIGLAGNASAYGENFNHSYCDQSWQPADVHKACGELGVRYSYGGGSYYGPTYGGDGRGFDCSGLTEYAVYQGFHKRLDHYTGAQYSETRWISWANRRPGDLVFFHVGGSIEHVGIYVGVFNGHSMMIAAPRTGEHVHIEQIYSAYWNSRASISFGRVK